MTTTPPTTAVALEVYIDGSVTDLDVVQALIEAITQAAQRKRLSVSKIVKRYDPPGLRRLNLGASAQAGQRRSAMGAHGIFTVDQLCDLTAKEVSDKLSPGTLIVVRQALYWITPRLSLKGDDPAEFPLLIDSLSISGATYGQLRNRGITHISQLTDDLITTFNLQRALTSHAKTFPTEA